MKGRIGLVTFLLVTGVVGCGDEGPTVPPDVRPPAKVADLDATGITDTSITLVWTAPGDDGSEGNASGYDVRYATTPDSADAWWDSVAVPIPYPSDPKASGETESLTVAPLQPKTDYYFALRSVDEAANLSELSNILHRKTADVPDQVAPGAILDLAVDSVTATSVVLSWTAPGDDGDQGTADSYDLRYAESLVSEEDWNTAIRFEGEPQPQPAGSREACEVVGLAPGVVYSFALRAVDEASNISDLSNVVSAALDATPPSAVVDLRARGVSDSSITLSWTAPGDDGQEGSACSYDLRYALEPITEESWEAASPVQDLPRPGAAGSSELFEVTGLSSRTTYSFALKSADEVPNWSALSNRIEGTTIGPDTRIFVVRPDGSGDYATIQEAIEAAADGDIIELTEGVYTGPGNRGLSYRGKGITIRSASGNPEDCVIDCEQQTRGISFNQGEGPSAVLEGVTIRRGYASDTHGQTGNGGGVLCDNSSPRILRCILSDNAAADWGGGFYCGPTESMDDLSDPIFIECTFTGNLSEEWGGAGACIASRFPRFERCVFAGNLSRSAAGVMCVHTAAVFDRCTFRDNFADDVGGGFWSSADSVTFESCLFIANFAMVSGGGGLCTIGSTQIRNCTFALNGAPRGGGIHIMWDATPSISSTIIAYGIEGEAIHAANEFEPLVCCDLFANMAGDWIGDLAPQRYINHNASIAPLFCNPEVGDYGLQANSPCAPENNPSCGLIGALPVACGCNAP